MVALAPQLAVGDALELPGQEASTLGGGSDRPLVEVYDHQARREVSAALVKEIVLNAVSQRLKALVLREEVYKTALVDGNDAALRGLGVVRQSYEWAEKTLQHLVIGLGLLVLRAVIVTLEAHALDVELRAVVAAKLPHAIALLLNLTDEGSLAVAGVTRDYDKAIFESQDVGPQGGVQLCRDVGQSVKFRLDARRRGGARAAVAISALAVERVEVVNNGHLRLRRGGLALGLAQHSLGAYGLQRLEHALRRGEPLFSERHNGTHGEGGERV